MNRTAAAVLSLAVTAAAAADLRAGRPSGLDKTGIPFRPVSGYLPGLLSSLAVPIESQVSVFSRTSAQAHLISPENPRVIYFSDDAAVGWVRGSPVVEVARTDPEHGIAFYTVRQDQQVKPVLTPAEGCTACHQSAATLGVPGLLTLSTVEGHVEGAAPVSVVTDHRTPLETRWGGWYVTGRSTGWKHQGNRVGQGWLVSLYDQFYDEGYVGQYSDIVALMVLEHQTRMTNLLTLLGRQVKTGAPGDEVKRTIAETVDYMLFVDEASLPARIIGTSGFAEYLAALGPRDAKGRSLRDFDLKTRLFRYPCSYMVYSKLFQQLPQAAKDAIYDRLIEILSDDGMTDVRYARLNSDARHAISNILADTQAGFVTRQRVLRCSIASSSSSRPTCEHIGAS